MHQLTLAFWHTLFKEAQLPFLYIKKVAGMPWWAVWHLLQACTRPEENKEANSYWWGTGLRINTIGQYLPAAAHRCWNHVIRDAKRWLQSHGAPAQNLSVYPTDVKGLFHLPTEKEYIFRKIGWGGSKMECSLYKSNKHPDIVSITRSVWSVQWSHQQSGQRAQLCPQTTAGVERSTGWLHDPGPALFTGVLPSRDSSWSSRSGELRSITPSTLLTKLLISEEIVYCPDKIIKLRRAWIHPLQLNQPSPSRVSLSPHVNTCINMNVQDVYSMTIRSV